MFHTVHQRILLVGLHYIKESFLWQINIPKPLHLLLRFFLVNQVLELTLIVSYSMQKLRMCKSLEGMRV